MRDDRTGTLEERGSRTLGRIVCVALCALALVPAGARGAIAGQSVGGRALAHWSTPPIPARRIA